MAEVTVQWAPTLMSPTPFCSLVFLPFSLVTSCPCERRFACGKHKSREARTACWLERRTHDRKFASSNPGRKGGTIFFSRVNFVCWLSFGVRSTPVLPQWHVKDPSHSTKSAGGRWQVTPKHLYTLDPWSRSGLTMPLSRVRQMSLATLFWTFWSL